jgi:hypothetical protein
LLDKNGSFGFIARLLFVLGENSIGPPSRMMMMTKGRHKQQIGRCTITSCSRITAQFLRYNLERRLTFLTSWSRAVVLAGKRGRRRRVKMKETWVVTSVLSFLAQKVNSRVLAHSLTRITRYTSPTCHTPSCPRLFSPCWIHVHRAAMISIVRARELGLMNVGCGGARRE